MKKFIKKWMNWWQRKNHKNENIKKKKWNITDWNWMEFTLKYLNDDMTEIETNYWYTINL